MVLIFFAMLWCGHAAVAQSKAPEKTFKGRLSPVPLDANMMSTITGSGHVKGVLAGNQLTFTGTFEGLRSSADSTFEVQLRRF